MFPAPTVIWNWGLQCDEAPKTDEMLARLEGREWDNVLTIIPHDRPLGMDESEDDGARGLYGRGDALLAEAGLAAHGRGP